MLSSWQPLRPILARGGASATAALGARPDSGSVIGTSKAHCPRQLRAFPRPLPKPVDPVNGTDGSANPMVGDLRVMVDFVVAVGADVDDGVGQFGHLVQEIVLGVVGDGVGLQQADP